MFETILFVAAVAAFIVPLVFVLKGFFGDLDDY